MRPMLLPFVAFLGACSGGVPTVPGGTDTGTLVGDDDDDATGPINDDQGSLVVVQTQGSVAAGPNTLFAGMFVETSRGWENLAQCVAAADSFCIDQWPSPDDWVPVQPFAPAILADLYSRDVGDTVTLGPWSAAYTFDADVGLGFYFQSYNAATPATGPLGVGFSAGEWGDYAGSADITPPTPIEITSHDPDRNSDFYDSEPIPLRWTPAAAGEVFLVVDTFAEKRLYALQDDGAHDLDLSGMGLGDGARVGLTLGRWSRATVDVDGHQLEVQIQSNQPIPGIWREIGTRSELIPLYDTCAEAVPAPAVAPGSYFGDFSTFAKNHNPGNGGCTGFAATGQDAVVPIELQPDDLLEISYRLLSDDGSLYLLTDCQDEGTCVEGSDRTLTGGTEAVSWFNATGAPVRVYAILDGFQNVTDLFHLDLVITSLAGDVLKPTCVEAIDQGPIVPGSYYGTLSGNVDLLDPDCAAPAGGGEGLAQVYLAPGQQLSVTASAPGAGNAKLYLLYNCSIADSCLFAADSGTGAGESLTYTNSTPFSEYLYLVLDSEVGIGEYFLDVAIQ